MALAPELPKDLLVEIGYFATDWAVVEQNLIAHTLEMSDGGASDIPLGFYRVRKLWFRLCRACTADEAITELESLNDRLARRSTARNYGLHGIWRPLGDDRFLVEFLEKDGSNKAVYRHMRIETTLADFKEQVRLMRDMRCDFLEFLNRHHPPKNGRGGVPEAQGPI